MYAKLQPSRFEALIYGKEVHVFGKPFYSGLGLTIDHNTNNKQVNNQIKLEHLYFPLWLSIKFILIQEPKKNVKLKK